MNQTKTYLVGRNSKTGQFVPAIKVYKNPSKYSIQRITKTVTVPKALKDVVVPPRNKK